MEKHSLLSNYSTHLYINYSINTKKLYLDELDFFINWWEERNNAIFSVIEVTILDIREYEMFLINDLKDKRYRDKDVGVSSQTVNKKNECIKTFFRYCLDEEIISNNPCKALKQLKTEKRENTVKWLDRNDKNRIVRVVNDISFWKREDLMKRNRLIIYLMLFGGLRLNEVASLKIENVDVSKLIITVFGKGGKTRLIDMNKEVLASYNEWLEIRKVESTYIFTSQKGDKISTQGIQHVFNKLKDFTKITILTPHVLRHTFAHDLATLGYSITIIGDILGHENLETTRIYTSSSREERKKAINSLI